MEVVMKNEDKNLKMIKDAIDSKGLDVTLLKLIRLLDDRDKTIKNLTSN